MTRQSPPPHSSPAPPTAEPGSDSRLAAARVLGRVLGKGRSLSAVLPAALDRIGAGEGALVQELCYGTLRWQPRLQYLLDRLLDRPLKAREHELRALLLLGLYQLLYLRVPPYAVVSATVAAARHLNKAWAPGLVNGVLRQLERRRAAWLAELDRDEVARHAHPAWLLARLKADWPQDWPAIVQANNAHPPYSLRVNLARLDRARYQERLAAAGLTAAPIPYCAAGLTLERACATAALPGFAEGLVSVQDGAGQLAAGLLELGPGLRLLDACAAPGGKTCHCLESEPRLADLLALDKADERLVRLTDNLRRLDLRAGVRAADALRPETWWDGRPFDRILVDAPCSASGVVRRHPDIKVLRQDADLAPLAAGQQALLARLWPLLAGGGLLLYAVCSVCRQETESVIEGFLAERPQARLYPIAADWGRALRHGRQILPGEAGMDGFYYARLVKNA